MTSGTPSLFGAAWQVVQYLFSFGLVLALAYVTSRSLRRLAPFARSRHLRLLDQLHLGTNRSFYLLAVAGKVVLVAMGEGGVATVATVEEPEQVAALLRQADDPVDAPGGPVTGFLHGTASRLGELWQRGGRPILAPAGLRLVAGLRRAAKGEDFVELLKRAQEGPGPGPSPVPGGGSAALRRQVERLRKLAGRTEG